MARCASLESLVFKLHRHDTPLYTVEIPQNEPAQLNIDSNTNIDINKEINQCSGFAMEVYYV